jgi:hypothetical protein
MELILLNPNTSNNAAFQSLGHYNNLGKLQVNFTRLFKDRDPFITSLAKLTLLTHLTLEDGQLKLNDTAFHELMEAISKLRNIINLRIQFSGKSTNDTWALYLSLAVSRLKKLQYLYLDIGNGSTSLTDSGLIQISEMLSNLSQLRYLNLNLKGRSRKEIP